MNVEAFYSPVIWLFVQQTVGIDNKGNMKLHITDTFENPSVTSGLLSQH